MPSCTSRAAAISAGMSSHSCVDPSMSLNRNVTVPAGRSPATAATLLRVLCLHDARVGHACQMENGKDTNDEEADRQLGELVQELRLVLPGTTVLFGFLLSVPFSSRFDGLTTFDRIVFFVAF